MITVILSYREPKPAKAMQSKSLLVSGSVIGISIKTGWVLKDFFDSFILFAWRKSKYLCKNWMTKSPNAKCTEKKVWRRKQKKYNGIHSITTSTTTEDKKEVGCYISNSHCNFNLCVCAQATKSTHYVQWRTWSPNTLAGVLLTTTDSLL